MTIRVILAFAAAQTRSYLREPLALGWTVFFPALLLLILGTFDTRPLAAEAIGRENAGARPDHIFLLGLFGLGLVLVQLRAIGFFCRLALTPQPPRVFVAGQALATTAVVLLTTLVLLVTGGLAFGIRQPARLALWSAFLMLGTGVFLGIGFALAATVRETRTAQMIGNVAFLALVFLGGVWYPIHVLPETVRWIGLMLPLTHLVQALRVTAIPGHDQVALGATAAVLVGWCLAASLIAVLRFRWNDPR
jgi:ABC-2 type transport system permease protein